jgi:hypothetical protein
MEVLLAFVPGIAGTVLMTLFSYAFTLFLKKPLNVVTILGTMLMFKTEDNGSVAGDAETRSIGSLCHYTVGIFFSAMYFWLIKENYINNSSVSAMAFGTGAGILAVTTWMLFIALHPRPPRLPLNLYLVSIFLGHVVFGISMYGTYTLLARYTLVN